MTTAGRPRQFDEAHVLESAMLLFWEQGYECTSLAQLKAATGLSSASLYNAFGSKEGLFERVVEYYVSLPGSVRTLTANTEIAPHDALAHLLHTSVKTQVDPSHPGGCLIALAATVVPTEAGSKAAAIVAAQRDYDRIAIRKCVDRVENGGVLTCARVSAESAATIIHTFILGLSVQVRDGVSPSMLHAAADGLLALWVPTASHRN